MSRKPGHDKVKYETILYALKASPHGSWVRDIAKKTGLKKSTVAHYLKFHLKDKIEVVHDSKHIKIIKLKEKEKEKETKEKPAEKVEKKVKPAAKEKEEISDEDVEDAVEQQEQQEMEEVPDYIS